VHGSELRNLLHPFLLLLIFERSGHGYDLIERLDELGVADVEPAHVYRVLRGLERDCSVASAWDTAGGGPARRRYELTPKGRADLAAWVDRLSRLDGVIGNCLVRWARATGPEDESTTAGPGRRLPPLRYAPVGS
jgi:poly-beta-hydroxybutyrate-responsive repressor